MFNPMQAPNVGVGGEDHGYNHTPEELSEFADCWLDDNSNMIVLKFSTEEIIQSTIYREACDYFGYEVDDFLHQLIAAIYARY